MKRGWIRRAAELRGELERGERPARHTELREWLSQ